jgi:hypothetical protein
MKLRIFLLLLVGAWVAGEVTLVAMGERELERRVAAEIHDAASVEADISTFPAVTRLALTGRVNRVSVEFTDVSRQGLTFAEASFSFDGVHVDRTALLRRDPRVESIDRGTATLAIDAGAISSALGRAVSLAGEEVAAVGSSILVGGGAVPLPRDLLPCDPEVRVEGERVIASCTVNEIPRAFIDAVQARR